jgi:hypothetical protein
MSEAKLRLCVSYDHKTEKLQKFFRRPPYLYVTLDLCENYIIIIIIVIIIIIIIIIVVISGSAAQRGLWPPRSLGLLITHNYAPHSIGILWASDHLVAETSTWQHTTHTTDKYP